MADPSVEDSSLLQNQDLPTSPNNNTADQSPLILTETLDNDDIEVRSEHVLGAPATGDVKDDVCEGSDNSDEDTSGAASPRGDAKQTSHNDANNASLLETNVDDVTHREGGKKRKRKKSTGARRSVSARAKHGGDVVSTATSKSPLTPRSLPATSISSPVKGEYKLESYILNFLV